MATKINIHRFYQEFAKANGVDSLPPEAEIQVLKQENMLNAVGRAFPKTFKRGAGKSKKITKRDFYQITLSDEIISTIYRMCGPEAGLVQLRETILHELAHIACFYLDDGLRAQGQTPTPRPSHGHDAQWAQFLRRMGEYPDRYACVDNGVKQIYVDGSGVRWDEIWIAARDQKQARIADNKRK